MRRVPSDEHLPTVLSRRPARRRLVALAIAVSATSGGPVGAVGNTEVATTMVELPPQRLVASVSTARTALTEGERVVVSGESLWSIASAALREHLGTRPSLDDVDFYWRAVVTMNLPGLQSGDADLIYPGETVVLPDFDRP